MKHWSDREILEHIYGLGPDDRHLESCVSCGDRIRAARARRLDLEPAAGPGFLARQHAATLARVGHGPRARWAPAVGAVAACTLLAFLSFRPDPAPEPLVSSTDHQLYSDIYASLNAGAPRAAEPLQALFEGQ